MEKSDKLIEILNRLNAGESPELVKKEAQEFLAQVDATELSMAEQKLIQAGLAPEDLRHLCSIHMDMLKDEIDKMKSNLEEDHVIDTLIKEHDIILNFLDELEETNQEIQKLNAYDPDNKIFKKLTHIADHLIGAEPHHQREEQVLFPEIESRGVTGPTRIMVMEHEDLRRLKHDIQNFAKNGKKMNFIEFKNRLDASVKLLIMSLRDHIFKENNILYPASLDVIKDNESWAILKEECDKIGYCCFTPQVNRPHILK
jgi:hypothetical protein